MAAVPPFNPSGHQYDQATYQGRLWQFLDIIDPRMLLVGDQQLQHAQRLVRRFRETGQAAPGETDAQLWQAKKVQDALVHPDTGEKIFLPLRMSAFVPVGIVFVLGMLRPNPSLRSALLWQWANQSSNAVINYANRNATADNANNRAAIRTMLESYCVAVAGSCGILAAATRALSSKGAQLLPPRVRSGMSLFVPLLSVCSANSFSLCVIRRRELTSGITLTTADGTEAGTSKIAARKAMAEMVISRGVLLPSTVLGIPPVVMAALDRAFHWAPSSKARLAAQAITCTMTLGGMLPLCLAMFPQRGSITVEQVEPKIRSGRRGDELLYYNKGL